MATKTIDNTTINSGYVLSNTYQVLSITSTGTINGQFPAGVGLSVPFAAQTFNAGLIAGAGAGPHMSGTPPLGYSGGQGATFAGGTFSNSGSVGGGVAGPGGHYHVYHGGYNGAAGGAGGEAVAMTGAGVVLNSGHIVGGHGGNGGAATGQSGYVVVYDTRGGNGGMGGAGVDLGAGGSVVNTGSIIGGAGGAGGAALSSYSSSGYAGAQGFGVLLQHGGVVTNSGGGALISGGVYAKGAAATITNLGSITAADYSFGVQLMAGGRIVDGGTAATAALITDGAYLGPAVGATLVNFGTIEGLVQFMNIADRFVAEAGSTLTGSVFCNSVGVLELVSGAETITDMGVIGTITGSVTMHGQYFSTYLIDAADSLTLAGTDRLRAGFTLAANGAVGLAAGAALNVDNGALVEVQAPVANAGTISLQSTTALTDVRILANGATLSGGGKLVMNGPKARIYGAASATRLTNLDNTITGTGVIGLGRLTLANQLKGVIETTTAGGLVIDTKGSVLTNNGQLEAFGSGGLLIVESTTVQQSGGGDIAAGTGGFVRLQDDDVIGGTLVGTSHIDITATGGQLDGGADGIRFEGLVRVISGASTLLSRSIYNTGQLQLLAAASAADLIVGPAGATLLGGGSVILDDSASNRIYGAAAADTLTNVDNRIEGAGQLGKGVLTLVNQAAGRIFGNQTVALTIDTGAATIDNAGAIGNVGKGGTIIVSAIANTGTLMEATAGTLTVEGQVTGAGRATINGGTLDVIKAFGENVTFVGSTGILELGDSRAFTGHLTGLSKTGTNSLDLTDISFVSGKTKATYAGTATAGVLTVTDGTHTAHIDLVGDYLGSAFTVSSDGHAGTKVVDPPLAAAAAAVAPLAQAMAAMAPGHGGAASAFSPPMRLLHHPILAMGRAAIA